MISNSTKGDITVDRTKPFPTTKSQRNSVVGTWAWLDTNKKEEMMKRLILSSIIIGLAVLAVTGFAQTSTKVHVSSHNQ